MTKNGAVSGNALLLGAFLLGCHGSKPSLYPDRGAMEEQRRCSAQAEKVVKKFEEETNLRSYLLLDSCKLYLIQQGRFLASIREVSQLSVDTSFRPGRCDG